MCLSMCAVHSLTSSFSCHKIQPTFSTCMNGLTVIDFESKHRFFSCLAIRTYDTDIYLSQSEHSDASFKLDSRYHKHQLCLWYVHYDRRAQKQTHTHTHTHTRAHTHTHTRTHTQVSIISLYQLLDSPPTG